MAAPTARRSSQAPSPFASHSRRGRLQVHLRAAEQVGELGDERLDARREDDEQREPRGGPLECLRPMGAEADANSSLVGGAAVQGSREEVWCAGSTGADDDTNCEYPQGCPAEAEG